MLSGVKPVSKEPSSLFMFLRILGIFLASVPHQQNATFLTIHFDISTMCVVIHRERNDAKEQVVKDKALAYRNFQLFVGTRVPEVSPGCPSAVCGLSASVSLRPERRRTLKIVGKISSHRIEAPAASNSSHTR